MPEPKQKRRTPARKFTDRRFTPQRLRRIERAMARYWAPWEKFSGIFETAEQIFRLRAPPKSRIIFLGQGMRPLFEAARGINELEQRHPREDLRYFVVPWYSAIAKEIPKQTLIQRAKEELKRARIVSKKRNTYYVVDYSGSGAPFPWIKKAIMEINPNAKVIEIYQDTPGFFKGLIEAEELRRPATKAGGRLLASDDQKARDQYLAFQKALQDYLAKKRKEKKEQ